MNGQFYIGDISANTYFLGGASALGVLFSVIIPSDGTVYDAMLSLIKWQLQTLLPVVMIIAVTKVISMSSWFTEQHLVLKLLLSGFLGACLFSPVATAIDLYLFVDDGAGSFSSEWLDELVSIALPITLGWLALNLPFVAGYKLQKEADSLSDELAADEIPFMQLLPPAIKSNVIALQSQLHYLEVATKNGKALILYNLADAIAELPENSGLQPHRSYWINRQFVSTIRRDGRQAIITMSNGQEIPVSRRLVKTVYQELEA